MLLFIITVIHHHHQNKGRGVAPQGEYPTGKLIHRTNAALMQKVMHMYQHLLQNVLTWMAQGETLHHPRMGVLLPGTRLLLAMILNLMKMNVSNKVTREYVHVQVVTSS